MFFLTDAKKYLELWADTMHQALVNEISKVDREVSDSTLDRRERAAREQGTSTWYSQRYGGGKKHTPPNKRTPKKRRYNDSGRMAQGIAVRLRRSSSTGLATATLNVPVNRLEARSFNSSRNPYSMRDLIRDLQTDVDILGGRVRHPDTKTLVREVMRTTKDIATAKDLRSLDRKLLKGLKRTARATLRAVDALVS